VENNSVAITETAIERRDALLARAASGCVVVNQETATIAADVLRDLKAFSRIIEGSRQDVKAPVLAFAKKIDDTARELTLEVDIRAKEIGQNLALWQQEQNRIAEELRRKAWEEEQRILREAQEADRQAKAEADRLAQEQADREAKAKAEKEAADRAAAKAEQDRRDAELAAQNAKNAKQRAAAQAAQAAADAAAREAADQQARAEQARIQADIDAHEAQQHQEQEAEIRNDAVTAAVIETRVAAAVAAPVKQAGIATQSEIKFEVTDIVALYEAAPMFVLLSPNNAAIKAALKSGRVLPGIRSWREAKSIVR
jgi:type IV secretory pathway VirB10-like protein